MAPFCCPVVSCGDVIHPGIIASREQLKINVNMASDLDPMLRMKASNIARMCEAKFDKLANDFPEQAQKLRKVLAGIVMERYVSDTCSTMKVVAVGAGTKIISEPALTTRGDVVVDCHAEILSRRALLRYLYSQLESCVRGEDSILERKKGSMRRYCLRGGVAFHLYISTNPCGDAAVFRDERERDERDAHPNRASRGRARVKMDAGMGGALAANYEADARFVVMSCSDKIARWNCLGLQGTLLSVYLDPIYLESITIGNDFNYQHNHRAVYERLVGTEARRPYALHCPKLSTVSVPLPERCAGMPDYGVNWTEGDETFEMLKCTAGKNRDETASRICKKELFRRFLRLKELMDDAPLRSKRKKLGHGGASTSPPSYSDAKAEAREHREAKRMFYKSFQERCRSVWLSNAMRHGLNSFSLED